MKLDTKKTIQIGFAFLSISAFWQMYNNVIPLVLTNTFHNERDDFRGHHGGGQYPGAVSAALVRRDFRPVQKQDGPQETFCPFRDDRGSDPDAAASAGG